MAECDLWLILSSLKQHKDIKSYEEAYQRVQDLCKLHNLELRGSSLAEPEWSIGKQLKKLS